MKEVKGIFVGLFLSLLWMLIATNLLIYLSGGVLITTLPSFPPERYVLFFSLIWAPIWEEMVFRWAPIQLALRTNEKYLGPIIILASAAFGIAHGFPQEGVLIQGILGLILSGVYRYTEKIWCSIVTHSLYNLSIFLLSS